MEPLNNERNGTANFFYYLEVFFIRRYKSIDEYAKGRLEKFNYERFFHYWGSSLLEVPLYYELEQTDVYCLIWEPLVCIMYSFL